MSEQSEKSRSGKIAELSLLLAAGACVALWLVRIYYAISFFKPYMLVTTGLEEESLFSVWKFTQHQAVYTDTHQIPFAASYFNWAYYWVYGSIASACLHLFHLDAIWIPTIGRLVSLVFTLLAGGMFCLTAREIVRTGPFARRPVSWAWWVIAACSPLIGFWSITVRPDIGALAFESAGIYMVLRYLRKQHEWLIILAAFLFYGAWAFKQSSVTMLTGAVLALLLLRHWRALFSLCGIWWLLVIVTLVAGGHTYRECLLLGQRHLPMVLSLGLKNLLRAESKNPFLLPCLAALVFCWWKARQVASRPMETTLALAAVFSFCFALLTSCKTGANDNYFLPVGWLAMLGFAVAAERMKASWIRPVLALSASLMIGAIVLTPTGRTFNYNYRGQDAVHSIVAAELSHLPGPALVTERYSNLPWVQRFAPNFVFGFSYYYDRGAGVPLESGGWEGMARDGYFGSIVCTQDYVPSPSLLAKYALVDEYRDPYTDLRFYRRMDPK